MIHPESNKYIMDGENSVQYALKGDGRAGEMDHKVFV